MSASQKLKINTKLDAPVTVHFDNWKTGISSRMRIAHSAVTISTEIRFAHSTLLREAIHCFPLQAICNHTPFLDFRPVQSANGAELGIENNQSSKDAIDRFRLGEDDLV